MSAITNARLSFSLSRIRRLARRALPPAFALAGLMAHLPAANAQYSKMVVLSDSMSDTHRYYDFTRATIGKGFPAAPAYEGRFCNGPVAVEVLAKQLGWGLRTTRSPGR